MPTHLNCSNAHRDPIDMIAGGAVGRRGSISSGLPEYLVQQTTPAASGRSAPTGSTVPDPGTHDWSAGDRFVDGYPRSSACRARDLLHRRRAPRHVIILGDEPHLDVERFRPTLREAGTETRRQRIVSWRRVWRAAVQTGRTARACSACPAQGTG